MDKPPRAFFAFFGKEFGQAFRSLADPNYRTYTIGQVISLTGSHIHNVALAWLTYQVTQSASLLAIVTLSSFVPVLLFSIIGGMIADRFDRRRVLMGTQVASIALASTLAFCVFTGNLSFWVLLVFGIIQGLENAVEMPVRQSFVYDVVGENRMVNAVGINSFIFNSTRFIGPAIAALILAFAGAGVCFVLNAVSFLAAIETIRRVKPVTKKQTEAPGAKKAPLTAGIRVAFSGKRIRNLLLLTGCSSFFAFQYSILLPVVVDKVVHGGPSHLSILTACAAIGSVLGSLVIASRGRKESLHKFIAWASIFPGIFLFLFSISTSVPLMAVMLVLLCLSFGIQLGSSNSHLQLIVPTEIRGRVMSVYTSVLIGAVPFGSLFAGRLADWYGVSLALSVCAVATFLSSLYYITRNWSTIR